MPDGYFAPVGVPRNLSLAGKRREDTSNFGFRSKHSTFEENVDGCRSCDDFCQRCHVKNRTYIGRDRERTCHLVPNSQSHSALIMPVNRNGGAGYFSCAYRALYVFYRNVKETFVKADGGITQR
jgi:hypothetical protein